MIYEKKYPSAASKEERRDIFSGKPVSDRRVRRRHPLSLCPVQKDETQEPWNPKIDSYVLSR